MKRASLAFLFAFMPLLPPKLPEVGPDAKQTFDQAFELCQRGKFPASLNQYERAVELAPVSRDVWMEYTVCLRKAGRLQRAARAGWRTLELGPPTPGIWANLGNVFLQAQEWDAASAAFQQAEKLSNDKRWAVQNYLNLGYRQWTNGRADLASATFDHALRMDPGNGQTLLDIGMVLASQRKREEATKTLERALAIHRGEGNRSAIALGEAALATLRDEGVLRPPLSVDASSQKLPRPLLAQPAQGKAISLPIDAVAEKLYRVPDGRTLSARAPEGWTESVEPSSARRPFTATYEPGEGPARRFIWTPFPQRRPLTEIRADLLARGQRSLPQAVEKQIDLVEVKSGTVAGYAFFLTDRSSAGKPPVEGDFPYMTQGIVQVGETEVRFTLLSVVQDRQPFDEMLAVLKTFSTR